MVITYSRSINRDFLTTISYRLERIDVEMVVHPILTDHRVSEKC